MTLEMQVKKLLGINAVQNIMAKFQYYSMAKTKQEAIAEGRFRSRTHYHGMGEATNDDSLRKMLYLASQRIVKHWHARCQNWDMVLSQLEIMFADRAAG